VVVAVTIGQVEAWTVSPGDASRAVVAVCLLAATLALGLVRIAPSVAALVVVAALVAKDLAGGPGELIVLLFCGIVTAFAVGLRVRPLRARLTLLALVAMAALGVVLGPEGASELAFSALALGAPWFAGTLVRAGREHARVLEEVVVLREREGEERARLAASEERSSIAREIHDLVGHSVSLMVLQAGAAEEVLSSRPDEAVPVLRAVQETGRLALADLHRVLGLLRSDQPAGAEPLPGLGDVERLQESLIRAGLEVTCAVTGDVAALPAGLSLAAYRIVQEALTNVVRHATACRAEVTIRVSSDALDLEVVDDGVGAGESASAPGRGVVGIRERVAMYGGTVDIGPATTGGFRIAARVPLQERE